VRDQDLAARIGGEEFALLLPETDADGALVLAERLGQAVAALPLPGMAKPLTVSGGVAVWQPEEPTVEAALVRADRALYAAKQAGRNRTRVYDPATVHSTYV
jgi:diguanylate cyclase (GGDEF)-like protein